MSPVEEVSPASPSPSRDPTILYHVFKYHVIKLPSRYRAQIKSQNLYARTRTCMHKHAFVFRLCSNCFDLALILFYEHFQHLPCVMNQSSFFQRQKKASWLEEACRRRLLSRLHYPCLQCTHPKKVAIS